MDRVGDILRDHIRLAERQLELMRSGIDFTFVEGPGLTVISTDEQDLLKQIASLQSALQRHEDRNA